MSADDMFFDGGPPPEGDAPIVLGPPPPTDDYGDFAAATPAEYGDFAAAPADYGDFAAAPVDYGDYSAPPPAAADGGEPFYVGDVNEANAPNEDTAGDDSALVVSNEPTPMQIWNSEWQATLLARKEEENARKAEFVEEARIAMETFSRERALKREATGAKNREDEQATMEAIEADLENDHSWQRVCKLVELQAETTDKSQDVKRMRDVMIFLKNETTKAVALST
jgi:Clathrin light chain